MSFWNTSEGDGIAAGNDYEAPGGNMEPIPANTRAIAVIDEAAWKMDQTGNRYASLRWSVLKPEEYNNRKIFQKLWLDDDDPRAKDPAKKRDTAKRMLAAIDSNCGGNLLKGDSMPDDDALSANLLAKPMLIGVQVWSMTTETGDKMSGNWIQSVSASDASKVSTGEAPQTPKAPDGEIPF